MGLTGIILGTIVAVTARAGIWMPWYVLRTLRNAPSTPVPNPSRPAVRPSRLRSNRHLPP